MDVTRRPRLRGQQRKSPLRRRIRFVRMDKPNEGADLRKAIQGQVLPTFTIIVLVVNILMLIVFYKGRFSSPTHLTLIAIAVADMMNGLFALIPSMHFFTFNNDKDFVPYDWCWANFILNNIARISHGCSLYYTVFLAAQRYIFVRFPFKARTLCSKKSTIVVIICIPFISIVIHLLSLIQHSTFYGVTTKSRLYENTTIYACARGRPRMSFRAVVWIENFFTRIFPIAALVILNILLVIELKLSTKHIQRTMTSVRQQMQNRTLKNRRITILTVAVVVSVLITEIPGFIAQLVISYSDSAKCKGCAQKTLVVVFQLAITICYPTNFLVYCLISSKFRKTLKNLLLNVAERMCPWCYKALSKDHPAGYSSTATSEDDTDKKGESTQEDVAL
ncbi:hypothetical protein FSP39_016562 [Pinctada imbricata]|uniref:G-protein coupled receptors family 1 profile domain-containing protein n=1 Tax=Pinctada imbricata TaxID=66713 RepID=A0AA88XNS8_PINIB|nr:hypothetical protein FSP39_016562 [Pinctada imbricata]